MKYLFITGAILLLSPMILHAQSQKEDVVYLKSGGILRGEILEMNENGRLKIEVSGRNVFVVSMDEVDNISTARISEQHYSKEPGYMNRTGFEVLHSSNSSALRLTMVNGYRFNSHFSAGIGFGISPYNDPLTLVPVFLDLKVRFLEANSSPYFFLKTGYNFSVHHDEDVELLDHKGGLLFNPGVGLHFIRNSGVGFYIQAGYNIDNSYYEFEGWWPQTVENEISFRRMSVGMGVSF